MAPIARLPRLCLFHWNAAEAEERAGRLRAAGFAVRVVSGKGGGPSLLRLGDEPPDAIVIDLSRLPAQGREVGGWLRRRKATRFVPLLFVGGEAEKVARVRALLPDAVYSDWSRIGRDLARALRAPPARPAVPGTMAGYSGTPLPKKLGVKAGSAVLLLGAPADFEATLGALPEGVRLLRRSREPVPLVLLFARSAAELAREFDRAASLLAERGALWLLWPKKSSGLASDLSEAAVRAFGLARTFVDYKICAVDATWSGLRFARRAPSG
jgi:hypothetical protein